MTRINYVILAFAACAAIMLCVCAGQIFAALKLHELGSGWTQDDVLEHAVRGVGAFWFFVYLAIGARSAAAARDAPLRDELKRHELEQLRRMGAPV